MVGVRQYAGEEDAKWDGNGEAGARACQAGLASKEVELEARSSQDAQDAQGVAAVAAV
jgi:hypothetical protein